MQIKNPVRVTRTYTQNHPASPSEVFALLCPVREAEWIEGWDPTVVYSQSGVAESDCVFETKASPTGAIWYITSHQPRNGFVEMIKITPEVTACRLTIAVRPSRDGSKSVVTYTHTSLGPQGDAFVESFTEEFYRSFMREWEAQINHYLKHATKLPGDGH